MKPNSNAYINAVSDQMRLVQANPRKISTIPNPDRMLQMAAVKADPNVYHLIKNPDPMVTDYCRYHGVVQPPSENELIDMVRPEGIGGDILKKLIDDKVPLSNTVLCAAMINNPFAIRYIKDPSRIVQLTALKSNLNAYGYIKQPDLLVMDYYNRETKST